MQAEARDFIRFRFGETLFDPVGERGRAVKRHAQVVVELAEVRVLDHFAPVGRRIEAADTNAESHDQVGDQRAYADSKPSHEKALAAFTRRACLEVEAGRRPAYARSVGRHRTRDLGTVLEVGQKVFDQRAECRVAVGHRRDDHDRINPLTRGYRSIGTRNPSGRDACRAPPAPRRSVPAS